MKLVKRKTSKRLFIAIDILLVLVFLLSLYVILIKPSIISHNKSSQSATEEQAEDEAKKIHQLCSQEYRQQCYKEELMKITKANDLVFAEKVISALQGIDPNTRSCHRLAHELSKSAIRQNPEKWKEILYSVNPNNCGGGFIHGVLEAHTGVDPNFVINSQFIEETCHEQAPEWSSQCIHIFGHIALLQAEGNLSRALQLCDGLTKNASTNCFNGLFMEDSFKTNLEEHGFAKNTKDPTKDKDRFEEVYSRCFLYTGSASVGCWGDLGPIFDEFYAYDYKKVYESCQKAPQEPEQRHCYFRAVASLAIAPEYESSEKLTNLCAPYKLQNNNAYERCITYLAASLTYNSPKFVDLGLAFCSAIESIYRENCLKALLVILHVDIAVKEQRKEFCQTVNEQVREFCLKQEITDTSRTSPFRMF